MRVSVLIPLVTAVLAATKCDARSGKSASRNSARVSKGSDLRLSPELVQENSSRNGLNASNPAQVASLTSKNNFINFCKGKKTTNGLQVKEGSCNGIVMGDIPSTAKMVSCKFQFPANFQTGIKAFQDFTVKLKINNLETGHFTNPNTNYYAAPQQLNKQGVPIGHTHIVINQINSFSDSTLADPLKFSFFKGIDPPGVDGVSSVVVAKGLPEGTFRLCSINTAANHQPLLMPVAQHNSNDDCIYFSTKFLGKTDRRRAQAAHRLAAQSADMD